MFPNGEQSYIHVCFKRKDIFAFLNNDKLHGDDKCHSRVFNLAVLMYYLDTCRIILLISAPPRQILGNKPYIQGAGFNKLPTIFKRRRRRLIVSLNATSLPYHFTSNISLCSYLHVVVFIFFVFCFISSFFLTNTCINLQSF